MKVKLPTGMLCACLLLPAAQILAQEAAPDPGDEQTPAAQQAPAQTPPAQTPAQTPPATAPGTPPVPKPVVQMPASKPTVKSTQEHDTGGDNFSIELFGWLNTTSPTIRGGRASTITDAGNLHFPGHTKLAEGAVVTYPTSHENSLEFTYFQTKGQGNVGLINTENFFGNDFSGGDTLATNWRVRAMKLSWNYLTYPYPSNGAKFRIKTLWEVQYVGLNGSFDAPADSNAVSTQGSKAVILPTLGVGFEYHPVKHVRFEAKGSGFGIVHHADIWNAEGSLVVKVGHVEVLAGERLLHYKTSPQSEEYFSQTLGGPYVGIRWVSR